MTRRQRFQGFLWFCTALLGLAGLFTVAFFVTSWIYNLLELTPPLLVIQLVNSFGGMFLFGLAIAIITRVLRPRIIAGEMKVYGPIIEALERIAKGDFKVTVENNLNNAVQERVIGELINSVNKMALELNQLETMRQEFISNVSHEIQSPLTSIRGFARVLRSDCLTTLERDHYLAIIEAESTRLSKLSDNLLRLASLEAEQTRFEVKPYRLDRQIRNLILACEPQWLDKALDMDVALQEVTITADEALLNQVWLNLLHNSIKFTPNQGRVCVSLNCCGEAIEFKISDTGIGISEEDQSHIFERFYKADKSRTGLSGGSGLGLSITQKIVELHRGTITVESKPEIGTAFTVCLPLH
jgi:signal transduction histidine kinase